MIAGQDGLQIARSVVAVLDGSAGCDAALATVVHRSGSAPQVEGARLLLRADGHMLGTVGGGAIEMKVLEACHETLRTGLPRRVEADLVRDLGMCCGGSMEIFVEYVAASARLVLVGAGHVAQALAPLATSLGYRLVIVDDRDELLAHPAFVDADRREFDADELADALPDVGPRDFIVVLTRDHRRDELALAWLLDHPHAYLGMIGSRRKVHRLLDRILGRYDERGQAAPALDRVHAPIGLALGGRTPAEIAVSVAAELIALRRGGPGGALNRIPELVRARQAAAKEAAMAPPARRAGSRP